MEPVWANCSDVGRGGIFDSGDALELHSECEGRDWLQEVFCLVDSSSCGVLEESDAGEEGKDWEDVVVLSCALAISPEVAMSIATAVPFPLPPVRRETRASVLPPCKR